MRMLTDSNSQNTGVNSAKSTFETVPLRSNSTMQPLGIRAAYSDLCGTCIGVVSERTERNREPRMKLPG